MSGPDRSTLVGMYDTMTTIKQCDERFRSMISTGEIFLIYYSPRGQEAVAAGLAAALRPDDYLVTTYRGLHDHLAKGVALRQLWAEFLGRADGTCKGKGGPMHITDPASGVMVTTGVVGSGLPIANGCALSSVLRGDGRVTAVTFGDGATNIGAFHEALNLAAVWALPVIFVCQNNHYAENTPVAMTQRTEHVADRAAAYGMAGVRVDGNDPMAMYTAMTAAVARARDGGGPTLLEAETYRFWGHYFGDAMEYMPPEERQAAMDADPVPAFRAQLLADGTATEEELAAIDAKAAEAIDDAVRFALASPQPDVEEIRIDVLAQEVTA